MRYFFFIFLTITSLVLGNTIENKKLITETNSFDIYMKSIVANEERALSKIYQFNHYDPIWISNSEFDNTIFNFINYIRYLDDNSRIFTIQDIQFLNEFEKKIKMVQLVKSFDFQELDINLTLFYLHFNKIIFNYFDKVYNSFTQKEMVNIGKLISNSNINDTILKKVFQEFYKMIFHSVSPRNAKFTFQNIINKKLLYIYSNITMGKYNEDDYDEWERKNRFSKKIGYLFCSKNLSSSTKNSWRNILESNFIYK